MTPDSNQALPQKAAKLITCVLPDDGSDKALMRKLRQEKQIINTSSVACRGIAVLQTAGIGHKRGGTIFMGPLINMTPFELPEGVPDEKAD
jgi:hypothetical protein